MVVEVKVVVAPFLNHSYDVCTLCPSSSTRLLATAFRLLLVYTSSGRIETVGWAGSVLIRKPMTSASVNPAESVAVTVIE